MIFAVVICPRSSLIVLLVVWIKILFICVCHKVYHLKNLYQCHIYRIFSCYWTPQHLDGKNLYNYIVCMSGELFCWWNECMFAKKIIAPQKNIPVKILMSYKCFFSWWMNQCGFVIQIHIWHLFSQVQDSASA